MFEYVRTSSSYVKLLRLLADSRWIALDTEFVSERRCYPELCLVQLACESGLFLLDPIALKSLDDFWTLLVEGHHETIVHAGRCDLEFCLRATRKLPRYIFDTQIAAGLAGMEYPGGYANIMKSALDITLANTETRTDWSRRPLNQSQIDYSLDDVRYLQALRNFLGGKLEKMGRTEWLKQEMKTWKDRLYWQLGPDQWQKLVVNSSMDRVGLAIVKSLYFWRLQRAESCNIPARKVLRDDLILELARRRPTTIERIQDLREMSQPGLLPHLPAIAAAINGALCTNASKLPPLVHHDPCPKMSVLSQLLYSALGTICRTNQLACNLVANQSDVRHWAIWRLRPDEDISLPILEQGWRKQIVGSFFDELIDGTMVVRVQDPFSDTPLEFLRRIPS